MIGNKKLGSDRGRDGIAVILAKLKTRKEAPDPETKGDDARDELEATAEAILRTVEEDDVAGLTDALCEFIDAHARQMRDSEDTSSDD